MGNAYRYRCKSTNLSTSFTRGYMRVSELESFRERLYCSNCSYSWRSYIRRINPLADRLLKNTYFTVSFSGGSNHFIAMCVNRKTNILTCLQSYSTHIIDVRWRRGYPVFGCPRKYHRGFTTARIISATSARTTLFISHFLET